MNLRNKWNQIDDKFSNISDELQWQKWKNEKKKQVLDNKNI